MGGGGTTETKSTTEPWTEAKPYYLDLYKEAGLAMDATSRDPYTGQLYAGMNKRQDHAFDDMAKISEQWGTGGQAISQFGNQLLSGKFIDNNKALKALDPTGQFMADQWARQDTLTDRLDPTNQNPYVKDMLKAALRPVERQFYESALPAAEDAAIASGAYGGGRSDVAKALATSRFGQDMGDISSTVMADQYENNLNRWASATQQGNQFLAGLDTQRTGMYGDLLANERARQMQAPQFIEGGIAMQLREPQQLLQRGNVQQQDQQAKLDAALRSWNMEQLAPWQGLGEMASILGSGGFSSTTQTQTQDSGFAGILQGLLGGISTLAQVPAFAPIFSDSRLKERITAPVGTTNSGLPIFVFSYKGEAERRMGVMAQDVLKRWPSIVFENDERLMIDLDRLAELEGNYAH